jgi:hypothetical protein
MSSTATTTQTLTADQHAEILGLMMASNPDKARADLASRLAAVEQSMAARARTYGDARQNYPLPAAVGDIRQQVAQAIPLRARSAAVADGSPAPAVAAPTPALVDAEVHAALLAAAGQRYVDDLRRRLAPAVAALEARLAVVVADLAASDGRHAAGNFAGDHDATFGRYASLVTSKGDLSARLATLRAGSDAGRAAQASAVKAAIDAAGAAVVAAAIRDSRLMQGSHWESHPGNAGLKAGAAAVAAIDADLAKLGGADAPGPVADSLRADRKAAAAALQAKRAAVDADLKAGVDGLIAAAIAGDEPARASIEQAARAEPRAFPSGFADSLQAAQWERSPIGPTALAMLDAASIPPKP